MTIRYVALSGTNVSPYDTWAKAAVTLKIATDVMGPGDITYAKNETHVVGATTTYVLAGSANNPCQLISTSDTANEPPLTAAAGLVIDMGAVNSADPTIQGKAYIFGVTFIAGATPSSGLISICNAPNNHIVFEECGFDAQGGSNSSVILGKSSATRSGVVHTKNCIFTFNTVNAGVKTFGVWKDVGSRLLHGGTQPNNWITSNDSVVILEGTDLSAATTTLIADNNTDSIIHCELHACTIGAGVSILSPQTLPGIADVFMYDTASGDTHYEFAHYDYWGNTTISTAINLGTADGAGYDVAENKHSWRVESVNGTFVIPYTSPWMGVYNEATAAITPRLEILRDGITTAYNNDEVWAEFSYKGTAGSTLAAIVTDRKALLVSAVAQSSSALGAGDWVGETTPWYGKLESLATITPLEIGLISARVCVAGGNVVYVNPKILGV